MLNVLLINDTRNWYHFGCHATSTALITSIQNLGYIVTTLSIKTVYEKGIGNNKIIPNTAKGFDDNLVYAKFVENNPDIVRLIENNNIVVINGEGTLHGLNPAPLFLLYTAYIAKKRFGKHVEIVNHSAYPEHGTSLHTTQASNIYKLVYSAIGFAIIRESFSLDTMQRLLGPSMPGLKMSMIKSFDCTPLYIRDQYLKSRVNVEKKPEQILVAGSELWGQVVNLLSNSDGITREFEQPLNKFSNYLKAMQHDGFTLVFLSSKIKNSSKIDLDFIKYVQGKCGVKLDVYQASSLNDWLKTIEESALLVSGRFHHTIAAHCLGTSFIAFDSNTPKLRGLVSELQSKGPFLEYASTTFFEELLTVTKKSLELHKKPNSLGSLCAEAEKNFTALKKLSISARAPSFSI